MYYCFIYFTACAFPTIKITEKCPQVVIDRKDMQYLYEDGDMYNFMDNDTYK